MKKSWILFIFSICLLSFVSAYYGSYYGGGFSLSDLLNEIDSETMLLGVAFIISFALINLSLQRVFKDNKAVPGVVAFCIALTIAWGINKSGFDLENIFYTLGFSDNFLFSVLPLALFIFFIYAVIKWHGNGIIGFGIFLFLGIFIFEEKGVIFLLAIIAIAIGIAINKWFPKKKGSTP